MYLEILYAILCKRTISIVAILVATICDILISLINKKWIKNIISLLPANNTTSMKDSVNNYFIYSYPHVLNYKSFSYHNYEYNYYDRDKYMKNMGYQTYLACGNGLEKRIDCSRQSDYDMISSTVSDYIDLDNFLVYYTTMSGHANYDDTRYSIKKNKYLVEDLPYSEIVKNYMASQIELDKALEYLVNALKEKNKLEDTVIVLAGDHPPYTLSESELKEMKTKS